MLAKLTSPLGHLTSGMLINFFNKGLVGSGCGSVGRAVPSDTRDLRFEFCHRQNFIFPLCNKTIEKTKIKKMGMAHL